MSEYTTDAEQEVINTPQNILRKTISKCDELETLAKQETMKGVGDPRSILMNRAELVRDLPQRIEQAIENGQQFPEEELEQLRQISTIANEALEDTKGTFSLSVILTKRGSRKGDPNFLEEVYQRVYGEEEKQNQKADL